MIKRVVDNQTVAHLWANQSQDSARNARHSMSFQGLKLYSYSTEIARIVDNARGERAYLVTTLKHSVTTTNKHMNAVRRAIGYGADRTVYRVPVRNLKRDPADEQAYWLADYVARRDAIRATAKRARQNKAWIFEAAQKLDAEMRQFCTFFDLVTPAPLPTDMQVAIDAAAEQAKARTAEQDRLAEIANAKRRAEMTEAREAWLKGDSVRFYSLQGDPVLLRVIGVIPGSDTIAFGTLQTSLGAEVSLAEAIKVFRIAMIAKANQKKFTPLDEVPNIGHYKLDHIAPNGDIRAGCHLIPWSESERIARQLGLID